MSSRNISLEHESLGPIGVLVSSKSNSEIDSTSHYRELIALQYPMHITTRHQVLRSVTYYLLHIDFP